MTIKTVLSNVLLDKQLQPVQKEDVIAFFKRYSNVCIPMSKYALRGKSIAVVHEILSVLGVNFEITYSKLDPNFAQLKFNKGCETSKFINTLQEFGSNNAKFFECLYVALKTKNYVGLKSLVEQLPDVAVADDNPNEDSGTQATLPPAVLNSDYYKISLITHALVKALFEAKRKLDQGLITKPDCSNFDIAMDAAFIFLENYYDPDTGAPINEDAPYILPAAVLEVALVLLFRDIAEPSLISDDNGKKVMIFKTDVNAIDLFRLSLKNHGVMWNPCISAPLSLLWNLKYPLGSDVSVEANPLRGYFFRHESAIHNANLINKEGIFVAGNAAVIHQDDAEDNVTPAMIVYDNTSFWNYLASLYYICYIKKKESFDAPEVEFTNFFNENSNFGVNECKAWDNIVCESHHLSGDFPKECIMAKYAMFFTARSDGNMLQESFYSALCRRESISLRAPGDSSDEKYKKTLLQPSEIAWEWFGLTHTSYNTNRIIATSMGLESNLLKFRKFMEETTPKQLATLSEASNEVFSPKENGNPVPEYTPVSAFVEGLCVDFKLRCQMEAGVPLPLVNKNNPNLITNIFSGVISDLAPKVGSEEDTGEVFPNVFLHDAFNNLQWEGNTKPYEETADDKNAFTKFLNRLKSGTTKEQVQFAGRSMSGIPRKFTLIVETNINSEKFFKSVDYNTFIYDAISVFKLSLVLQNKNPFTWFPNIAQALPPEYGNRAGNHYEVKNKGSYAWNVLFRRTNRDYSVPGHRKASSHACNCELHTRTDSKGRLVLIFSVAGPLLSYMKLLYRYASAMPLYTRYLWEHTAEERRANGSSIEKEVVMDDNLYKSIPTADKILNLVLNYQCTRNFSNISLRRAGRITPLVSFDIGSLIDSSKPTLWFKEGAGRYNAPWVSISSTN